MTNIAMYIKNFYKIIPLKKLRQTPGVNFDCLLKSEIPQIDAIDRVLHENGAISPGKVSDVERPWYMHPYQADNLMVLMGTRYVDIYERESKQLLSFEITPHMIKSQDQVIFNGPAMLVWSRYVFHRIKSCDIKGSASINLATHYKGFNIKDNFNIYDLDVQSGEYRTIREGHLDQPS